MSFSYKYSPNTSILIINSLESIFSHLKSFPEMYTKRRILLLILIISSVSVSLTAQRGRNFGSRGYPLSNSGSESRRARGIIPTGPTQTYQTSTFTEPPTFTKPYHTSATSILRPTGEPNPF